MDVSSNYDIFRLIAENPRKKATDKDNPFEVPEPPAPKVSSASGSSDGLEGLIAEFQARLAHSNFNRSDLNGDGIIERQEFVTEKLIPRETYQFTDAEAAQMWDQLDTQGRGQLNEAEYTEALSKVFQVSAGKFDKPLR
ncbi:MAG: hypothetical protein KL863_05205 [Rhizobium sp.]|nr:hypothetical protein [Rhizobium sp.]